MSIETKEEALLNLIKALREYPAEDFTYSLSRVMHKYGYEHWYLLQGDVWSSTLSGTHALCIKMHDCCFIFPLLRYLPDAAEQLLSDINNLLSHYARPKE